MLYNNIFTNTGSYSRLLTGTAGTFLYVRKFDLTVIDSLGNPIPEALVIFKQCSTPPKE